MGPLGGRFRLGFRHRRAGGLGAALPRVDQGHRDDRPVAHRGHGAHLWLTQIEGRRLFFLFSPQESSNLYAGVTTGESPVDVFFPSAKRHPRFAEARAQVVTLYLGQTLVIPAGWWWYSVALEPSVTLGHHFWNMENKVYFSQGLRENFDFSTSGSKALR